MTGDHGSRGILTVMNNKTKYLLVGFIEEVEGRVPSDEEIECFLRRYDFPNKVHAYTYKGTPVAAVDTETGELVRVLASLPAT